MNSSKPKSIVCAAAALVCLLLASGCQQDSILVRADQLAAESAEASDPGVPGEPAPGEPPPGEGAADPAQGIPDEPTPGIPGSPQPPGLEGGSEGGSAGSSAEEPIAGVSAEPTPGVPSEPTPGAPGTPGGGSGLPGGEAPDQGPMVTLTGSVSLDQWPGSGEIRIDVFNGDQQDLTGPRPKVIGVAQLSSPGRYTVSVPQSAGKVWIGAYADLDGDGRPGNSDPSAWYLKNPVSTKADRRSLDLKLIRHKPPPDDGLE